VISLRIYKKWSEAWTEILRDVRENSVEVHPQTMQDKEVKDDPDYLTKEIIGYSYRLVGVKANDVVEWMGKEGYSDQWTRADFLERISHTHVNPGEAYKLRGKIWDEFLHRGKFAYSYNERLNPGIDLVVEELKRHPDSRQCFIPIFHPDDMFSFGTTRIPCSLGYYFKLRKNELILWYSMRSCDVFTHFPYDVALALMTREHIAQRLGVEPGWFQHTIGSLHAYSRDYKGKGIF
jgi:thymidylate synthase